MNLNSDESVVSSISIGPAVDEVTKVTGWMETLADQDDWPPRTRFGIELALEEAVVNVISYGFEGRDVAPLIRVEYLRLPGSRVAFRIIDNGTPFDPTAAREPDLAGSVDEAGIGGHGIRLMRHYLSDIAYARVGDQNQLTLVADLMPKE